MVGPAAAATAVAEVVGLAFRSGCSCEDEVSAFETPVAGAALIVSVGFVAVLLAIDDAPVALRLLPLLLLLAPLLLLFFSFELRPSAAVDAFLGLQSAHNHSQTEQEYASTLRSKRVACKLQHRHA